MEQTKGYLTVRGKIWGLNNKEPLENSATKFLSFGIQTKKDNSFFIQVGEWKNTTLNIKVRGKDMTEVEELNEQDAIDKIKEVFKDGDSVFINARAEVDTYRKSLRYLVNQIYLEKEPIDFDKSDFEETNELNQTAIIIDNPSDRKVKVGLTTFREEMIEQELRLDDNDVNDYFNENVKVGDVMKLSISVNRQPHYVDQGEEKARKTLKGKTLKTGGKKIDGYEEFLEIIDVDIEKTEKKKYERNEIRKSLDLAIENQEKRQSNNKSDSKESGTGSEDITPIDDGDLPF